jgi:hypothetical protein
MADIPSFLCLHKLNFIYKLGVQYAAQPEILSAVHETLSFRLNIYAVYNIFGNRYVAVGTATV